MCIKTRDIIARRQWQRSGSRKQWHHWLKKLMAGTLLVQGDDSRGIAGWRRWWQWHRWLKMTTRVAMPFEEDSISGWRWRQGGKIWSCERKTTGSEQRRRATIMEVSSDDGKEKKSKLKSKKSKGGDGDRDTGSFTNYDLSWSNSIINCKEIIWPDLTGKKRQPKKSKRWH